MLFRSHSDHLRRRFVQRTCTDYVEEVRVGTYPTQQNKEYLDFRICKSRGGYPLLFIVPCSILVFPG